MLGNNETIEGISSSDLFQKMLKEIPWSNLRVYIQSNAQILKACTLGGRRLDPQQRGWFEKMVLREAEKSQFSEAICNGVFAAWYPVREELHNTLEDYFHSDEYKDYRAANEIPEDSYVLSDDKFNEFFSVSQTDAWRILLRFSPLKFTKEQADKVLDTSAGNVELLEQLKELKEANADLQRKNASLQGEAEKLRAKQQTDAQDIQEQKRQSRQLRQDIETWQRKCESQQAEIKRLNDSLTQKDANLSSKETEIRDQSAREISRVQNELDRIQGEIGVWKTRYEGQLQQNRQLEEDAKEAVRQAKIIQEAADKTTAESEKLRSFADLLLSRIDWPRVGAAMKMNPTVRRNFNSLVRKLNYEDNAPRIEEALPAFWDGLQECEKKLVAKIAKSNTEEVMNGNMDGYWDEISQDFEETQLTLEARMFMLGLLRDVFFQTFEPEDLEKPIIPPKKK